MPSSEVLEEQLQVPPDSLRTLVGAPLRHAWEVSVAVERAIKCEFAKERGSAFFSEPKRSLFGLAAAISLGRF